VGLIPEPEQVPDSMERESMVIVGEILLTVSAGLTAEPEKFCKIFCDF